MAYVDLNPVRAGMAATPEESQHTSIRERITPRFNLAQAVREQMQMDALLRFDGKVKPLLHFEGGCVQAEQTGIPFAFEDYLALVDYTGRAIDPRKKGAIANAQSPILLFSPGCIRGPGAGGRAILVGVGYPLLAGGAICTR